MAERIRGKHQAYNGPCFCTEDIARQIDKILALGDRVELIPVKDGVRVIQVQRKEVKEVYSRR